MEADSQDFTPETEVMSIDEKRDLGEPPEELYEVHMLNWDQYKKTRGSGKMRVEEELIRQTMNAEEITINELLLEPKGQSLAVQGSHQFIEGELRYLTD